MPSISGACVASTCDTPASPDPGSPENRGTCGGSRYNKGCVTNPISGSSAQAGSVGGSLSHAVDADRPASCHGVLATFHILDWPPDCVAALGVGAGAGGFGSVRLEPPHGAFGTVVLGPPACARVLGGIGSCSGLKLKAPS